MVDARQTPLPMRSGAGGSAQTVSHERHDAADVGFVADVDGTLGAALVERAQEPAPVPLNEEPDDSFPAAPGIAHRDQAAVCRGLVGIDLDVVAHPHARAMASSATRTMNVSRPNVARPTHRRGAGAVRGVRAMVRGVRKLRLSRLLTVTRFRPAEGTPARGATRTARHDTLVAERGSHPRSLFRA